MKLSAGVGGGVAVPVGDPADRPLLWGKVLDQDRCIGCHACTVACKSENEVALGGTRTFIKQVEIGMYPNVRRHFQVTRCNQCEDAPCVAACPVTAMFQRPDGIVDFDRDVCIGCKACIAACPYDAIFIDPVTHSAEKCNFCSHRIEQGLQPACVSVCPEGAIIVGDINDPESEISRILSRERVTVRKPHKNTRPKVFYKGADVAALEPSAATVTPGFFVSQRHPRSTPPPPPVPASRSSAAVRLAYDNTHKAPWDWRVSLYTWTKSLAAGAFGCALLLPWTQGSGPLVGVAVACMLLLLITAGLIVADLEHPTRFVRIVLRPQWRSWLARGAFILMGYGALLALFIAAPGVREALRLPGVLLAAAAAGYTGFLFLQCRGRDLWQQPALPAGLLVQAGIAGSAALLIGSAAGWLSAAWLAPLQAAAAAALGAHLLLTAIEWLHGASTADGRVAAFHLRRGVYAPWYWAGILGGAVVPLALVFVSPLIAAALAIVGLLAYQHALVQAGQAVALS